MRFFFRAAAVLVGHFLAAQAVGLSAYSWPDCLLLGIPTGVFFALGGFPYLILELPTAAVIYWAFYCCRIASTRVLIAIVSSTLGSAIGYVVAPRVGEGGRLYHEGYAVAGFVFAVTILIAAYLTSPKHAGDWSGRRPMADG